MSSSSSASEAQMQREIELLTAKIDQHKKLQGAAAQAQATSHGYRAPYYHSSYYSGRNSSYVNPNYKPANKYIRPGYVAPTASGSSNAPAAGPSIAASAETKDVVINGVAFESSGHSLVRKDLPKPAKPVSSAPAANPWQSHHAYHHHPYARNTDYIPARGFKKMRRGRARNMTLDNTGRKGVNKRVKQYSDKPCPRFTTKGSCNRGLTCPYQHDPAKIAICWNFLQDNCPYTAETCSLSHDPTPERTPLCVHFSNKGRCTRAKCPFPHVKVGQRNGVCRDFAVLGYCSKGVDCDKQHVRECPDFAENGTCGTKGCKLPHVIRANRTRKAATMISAGPAGGDVTTSDSMNVDVRDEKKLTAEDGDIGDEYISLTFNESDESDDESPSSAESGDESEEE